MDKVRKATSTSYALKAFRGHLITLWERQLITEEEYQEVLSIYKTAIKTWHKAEFGDEGDGD